MCFQTLSISNDILCSTNHFLGTHLINSYPRRNQLMIMQFDQKSKSGFCYSTKRVSKSSTGLVKGGALVGVRCEVAQNDGFYIRRCVELARTAIGCTSPNPMVGCVIVKDGKIVGEGYHPKAGQPHAEVFALRDAGKLAEGGTTYVTLEPCNHFGRTPPCTDALIKARVKKVVVGMVDPNPIVASKGVHKLQDAGIEVTVGVEEELCKKLNEAYIHQMLTGKPFVTLRYSMSVNGHIINQLGDTGLDFGGYYSKLLQEYDAVVISASLLSDNLSFPTSKEPGANQPVRIILTKSLDSPIHITAFNSETASKAIIFTVKEASLPQELTEKGVENVVFERISLASILEYCKRQGFCSVLLDLRGNFTDFEEILREGSELDLFQKYVVEILPVWGWSKESSFKNFPENFKVKSLTSRVLGETILLEGYFK